LAARRPTKRKGRHGRSDRWFSAREYQNSCGHGPCRRREPYLLTYLHRPLAYGALGLIDFTRDLRIKESLSFTPSQLAGIGVWLTLPWTVKMVFGELVDTVPMFGSGRNTARSARSGLLTMSSMPLRIAVIAHGAARAASGHAAAAPPRSAMRSRRAGLKAEHRFWLWFSVAPCSFQCRGKR
jgi:hypothetical protein